MIRLKQRFACIWIISYACLPAAFSSASAYEEPNASQGLASIRIGMTPGTKIPSTFMGLSHEWGDAQRMMGDSKTGINSIYRQLLANLLAYGSGPMILRIGGNSTDGTGVPLPDRMTPCAELFKALGPHFILGVNLGTSNVNLAATQTKIYLGLMPPGSVDAIEIGNEPDLYPKRGMRLTTYSVNEYLTDLDTWKASLQPLLPKGTKIMWGAWASSTPMLSTMQNNAPREPGTLFSQHYYLTSPAAHPPSDILLRPKSSTLEPTAIAAAVKTAHAQGIPTRMGEFNSVDGEGIHGISDAFGAALWAVDTMFEYANAGVDGVNWESSTGNFDSPFYFAATKSNGMNTYKLSSVNPLYYGLLFFQAATGNRASLLPVTLTTQANLKAWATMDASGSPHLAIINKDEHSSGTITVSLPGYSHASIVRLAAPSYQALTGVTFAGQTLDGSTDGTLRGTKNVETAVGRNGNFQIPVAVTSAALVTFTK